MTDLFEASGIHPPDAPLADRLRPATLDEVVGQDHLLGEGGPIRRMVEAGRLGSMIRVGGRPAPARPPSPACWPPPPAISSSRSAPSSRAWPI